MKNKLYRFCKNKNLLINKVAEVGVYYPETSNIIDFINEGLPTLLVEADPIIVEKINTFFEGKKNVSVYPFAIFDKEEPVTFYRTNASTFLGSLESSPALVNDKYQLADQDKFTVDARLFSSIDSGDIDLLSIDIEGAEWYVIKHLISRPKIISAEWLSGEYSNPFMKEIKEWMKKENYKLWFIDDTDGVFYKTGEIKFNFLEKTTLLLLNFGEIFKHKFQKLRRKIKGKF